MEFKLRIKYIEKFGIFIIATSWMYILSAIFFPSEALVLQRMIWFVFCCDALGFGCDDRKVIEILAHRNDVQRQELRREYKIRYNKDLIDTLKSELHAKFEVRIWFDRTTLQIYLAILSV